MPAIDLYLDLPDLPLLEQFLNEDEEIVFVVPSEPGGFVIVESMALQPNATYTLWHVPSGDIPSDCRDSQGRIIVNPRRGIRPGAFGLTLEVSPGKYQQMVPRPQAGRYDLKMFEDPTAIGRSGIDWVGNKYAIVGMKAHPSTDRWWKRLRRWVSKHARKVTWFGPLDKPGSEMRVWAFPAAYAAIQNGRPRSVNPVLGQHG